MYALCESDPTTSPEYHENSPVASEFCHEMKSYEAIHHTKAIRRRSRKMNLINSPAHISRLSMALTFCLEMKTYKTFHPTTAMQFTSAHAHVDESLMTPKSSLETMSYGAFHPTGSTRSFRQNNPINSPAQMNRLVVTLQRIPEIKTDEAFHSIYANVPFHGPLISSLTTNMSNKKETIKASKSCTHLSHQITFFNSCPAINLLKFSATSPSAPCGLPPAA